MGVYGRGYTYKRRSWEAYIGRYTPTLVLGRHIERYLASQRVLRVYSSLLEGS